MDIKLKNGDNVKVMVIQREKLYEYYIQGVRIGVWAPESMEDNILFIENTLENELSGEIKDAIDLLDRESIKQEGKENRIIGEYAKEIGVERIRDIYTIELDEKKKEEKEEKEKKSEEEEQKNNKGEIEIKRATTQDVNIKQEVELSERANDMGDLKKWLGGKIPPEFTKVAVIDGDEMNQMTNEKGEKYQNVTTRYVPILVDKNNNIEPLAEYVPELQQKSSEGNNPTEQKYQINKDGKVEKDEVLSEWELGNKIIQIDNKEMGRVEINIGQVEHGGNETLVTQLRDSNSTYTTSTEMRSVLGEYERNGEYAVDENLKEVKKQEEQNPEREEELTYKDIDGDENTSSQGCITEEYVIDEDGEKYTYEDLATRWGKYDDGKPDAESVKEMVEKESKDGKTVKEIIDDADERYEDPRLGDRGK